MKAFRREIFLVLVLKIILIYAIWAAFFSSPLDKKLSEKGFADSVFGKVQQAAEKGDTQ